MASALFWAIVVPLVVLALAIAIGSWCILFLPMVYAVQILRIAVRRGRDSGFKYRLRAAAMTMLVKIAESKGVLRYWLGLGGEIRSYRELPIVHENGVK